jgi:hypothetical protein
LFVESFCSVALLTFGLLTKVLAAGFGIDPSSYSMIWCKMRLFIGYTLALTCRVCICFASIDRFFISCRSVVWCRRSKLTTAKLATFIALLVTAIINIPYLVFYSVVEVKSINGSISTTCSLTSTSLVLYGSYFFRPVLLGLLPIAVVGIVTWLTYQNISAFTNAQTRGALQRRLTLMVFAQIFLMLVATLPYAIAYAYQAITLSTVKTSYRVAQETLALDIINVLVYTFQAGNFYAYFFLSSSYRRVFIELILFCYRPNRVNPIVPMNIRQQQLNVF